MTSISQKNDQIKKLNAKIKKKIEAIEKFKQETGGKLKHIDLVIEALKKSFQAFTTIEEGEKVLSKSHEFYFNYMKFDSKMIALALEEEIEDLNREL